jgi:predicted Fe-Mo cluster-binding NifX family protein
LELIAGRKVSKVHGGLKMKKIGLLFSLLVFFTTGLVCAEDKGRIAVAAVGTTPAAEVSSVATRTPYFLIFDDLGAFVEAVENPHKEVRRRASELVVQLLAQKGVAFFVAGDFGHRMVYTLRERNIEYMEFQGTAEEALKKVMEKRKSSSPERSFMLFAEARERELRDQVFTCGFMPNLDSLR